MRGITWLDVRFSQQGYQGPASGGAVVALTNDGPNPTQPAEPAKDAEKVKMPAHDKLAKDASPGEVEKDTTDAFHEGLGDKS